MTTAIRRQYIFLPKHGNITIGSRSIRSRLSSHENNIRLLRLSSRMTTVNIRRRHTAADNILRRAAPITISSNIITMISITDNRITAIRAEKDRAVGDITTIRPQDAAPISQDKKRKRRRKNVAAEFQKFS